MNTPLLWQNTHLSRCLASGWPLCRRCDAQSQTGISGGFLSPHQMNICQNSDPAVQCNHWQGSDCYGYELLNYLQQERERWLQSFCGFAASLGQSHQIRHHGISGMTTSDLHRVQAFSLRCTPSPKPSEPRALAGAASFQENTGSKLSYISFIVSWLELLKVLTVSVFLVLVMHMDWELNL